MPPCHARKVCARRQIVFVRFASNDGFLSVYRVPTRCKSRLTPFENSARLEMLATTSRGYGRMRELPLVDQSTSRLSKLRQLSTLCHQPNITPRGGDRDGYPP